MSDKKYFIGVDPAADSPIASTPLVDAIICSQKVKQRIEEALKGKIQNQTCPPGVQEVTVPIKIITVPGMDLSSAYLISPSAITQRNHNQINAQFGAPNLNSRRYGASLGSNHQAPFYYHQMPGVGMANAAALKNLGWEPKVFADTNERCENCENALICSTEEVCPVVCAGCKKRFLLYNDCEIETHQICLGFDWKEAKKDYQCDACAEKVIYGRP